MKLWQDNGVTLASTLNLPAPDAVAMTANADSGEYAQLRALCLDLPLVKEAAGAEQTSFKVDQCAFVVIETYRTPEGKPYYCMAFKASFFDHERLVKDRDYFPAPYLGGPGWLGRRLDNEAAPIDWEAMQAVLMRSHRQIAGRVRPAA